MNYLINNQVGKRVNETSRMMFQLYIVLWWMQPTVLTLASPVLKALPVIGRFGEFLIPGMMLGVLCFAIPYIVKQLRYQDLLFYMVVTLLVMGSILFWPENEKYINASMWRIMCTSAAVFFLGVSFDYDMSRKMLYWSSVTVVMVMYAYQLYQLRLGRALTTDNLGTSYNVLPSVLCLACYAIEHNRLRHWIIPVVGALLVFSYGSRGPIVAAITFLLLAVLLNNARARGGMQRVIGTVIIGIILLVFTTTDKLVDLAKELKVWFAEIGFSTRVFDMFIQGRITYDSGRGAISEKIIAAIWENPILGHGLMGDRAVLVAKEGDYAHNFFLEMWCDFGIVVGTVLILMVISLAITAVIRERKNRLFVLMIVTTVMVKLTFSGSFIVEPYFFLMLGICVRTLRCNTR